MGGIFASVVRNGPQSSIRRHGAAIPASPASPVALRESGSAPRALATCPHAHALLTSPALVVASLAVAAGAQADALALGSGKVLAYGRSIRRGRIRCTSRESGVTRENARGHGFRISRASYRRF